LGGGEENLPECDLALSPKKGLHPKFMPNSKMYIVLSQKKKNLHQK